MQSFRLLLMAFTAVISVLTVVAIAGEGPNLFVPFFSAIFALSWQGQFNVDFTLYLVLSGLWMAWRGGFSGGSIALGLLAPPLGMLFLAPYLLFLLGRTGGDLRRLLLGVHAY